MKQLLPNVYLFGNVLSHLQIQLIHREQTPTIHHDDGGHSSENHLANNKRSYLPLVASHLTSILFAAFYRKVDVHGQTMASVDPKMKLYRLTEGMEVPVHKDADFYNPDDDQSIALYSVIVNVGGLYTGGETIFNHTTKVDLPFRSALAFRHDVPHSGARVISGEKIVLKTDIFFNG